MMRPIQYMLVGLVFTSLLWLYIDTHLDLLYKKLAPKMEGAMEYRTYLAKDDSE